MTMICRAALLFSLCATSIALSVAKKGDGFDGFGTPDPFNQNDDDQVDAGEPNAPDAENPNDDANMVSDDDDSDDDSFVQVASKKVAKKGDGFDGFGTPDPFNQNDDDQVDAGEPNAPDAENPNDDANMVSDDDDSDDDSLVQVASKKVAKKGDGFDGFGTPDPFNQNDDDQVDAGEPNAPDAENPNDDANMVSDDDDSEDDSLVQVASKKVGVKGDGFDGFGTPDPFNQNDDDQVDAGEPNAPDAENPNDDANMVSDDDDTDDDDSFVQVASKKVAKKGDGFDGFGTPDPFNQNDDDQVDAGEPNAPDAENPNDDANMVSDDDDSDDDSFVQVASKKVAKKGDGFDGFGTPDPFNQNDDDQVDAGEPNAPDAENPNDDANMVSDNDDSDDDSFVQVGQF